MSPNRNWFLKENLFAFDHKIPKLLDHFVQLAFQPFHKPYTIGMKYFRFVVKKYILKKKNKTEMDALFNCKKKKKQD